MRLTHHMGAWLQSLEAKARIIHGQLAEAGKLAAEAGLDPDDVSQPYLDLINDLYRDECQFAQLVDDADLIVRYSGPAISIGPTMSMFTSVCRDLRSQIQGVAKAIFGLSLDEPLAAARRPRLRWPNELDPLLSGLAHGSLVVGVRIQSPDEDASQPALAGISDSIVESVRMAVKNIATVSRHVDDNEIDEDAIQAELPDPAIRDTVLVAAAKLAPTGRKQYKSVSFYSKDDATAPARELTPSSRRILNRAVARPVRTSREGSFEGVIRAVDLDARRFEIRRVANVGAIRCVYQSQVHELVRHSLDARVRVTGQYETLVGRPRLIAVSSLEVLERPAQQSEMPVGSR